MLRRGFALAAIVGGLLWAPPDLLTNVWPAEEGAGDDHRIESLPLYATYVVGSLVAAVALAIAAGGLPVALADSRVVRVGVVLLRVGFGLLAANALLALTLAFRGGVLDFFALFGLGFLALVLGHALVAVATWRSREPWPSRAVALVATVGAVLVFGPDAVHVAGLVAFGLAWTAAGVLLLARRAPAPQSSAVAD